MEQVIPVILAGGGGTRLWPLSRADYPKQFIALFNQDSLLQNTADRLVRDALPAATRIGSPWVVCNRAHRFLCERQLHASGHPPARMILEPCGRNTAPALTAAAVAAVEDGDPVLVMMPADHAIADTEAFRRAVLTAITRADETTVVTLGIVPDAPETGYGYIEVERADGASVTPNADVLGLVGFVEKPDVDTAQRYLDSGNYYWNSGIFVLRASLWLKAISEFRPDIADAVERCVSLSDDTDGVLTLDAESFAACPSESIDYAVMERIATHTAYHGAVVPLQAGWSDVGAWTSVWSVADKDHAGNVLLGDTFAVDSTNCLAMSRTRLVAMLGCEDIAVVETDDAILVARRSHSQQVKQVVDWLNHHGRAESRAHLRQLELSGSVQTLAQGRQHHVHAVAIDPSATRVWTGPEVGVAQHCTVVAGSGLLRRNAEVLVLEVGNRFEVRYGEICEPTNKGSGALEIIAVTVQASQTPG